MVVRRYWFWAIAALVIVIIIGLVWWIVASHKPNSKNSGALQPTPTISVSAPNSAAPSATPPAVAIVGCNTNQLTLTIGSAGAAAGTTYTPLVYTNISSKPCSLEGFAGVSLVSASGAQIGQPATRDLNKQIVPIILIPKGKAHTTVSLPNAGNYPPGTCTPNSESIKVYPPNQTTALITKFAAPYCGNWNVEPVVAGVSDQ